MIKIKVILISGKAQSGKDTFARMLKDILETDYKLVLITHFADLLKYVCKEYFNWSGSKNTEGRRLLQYVGTDIIRKNNPDFFVDFIADILSMFDMWDVVIIPDCRFKNEIDKMTEKFDTVHIRMIRENADNALTQEQSSHISENDLNDIKPDFYIENNGSLEELKAKATIMSSPFVFCKRSFSDLTEDEQNSLLKISQQPLDLESLLNPCT